MGRAIKSKSPGTRPFIVGETKSNILGLYTFIQIPNGLISLSKAEHQALPKFLEIRDEEKLLGSTKAAPKTTSIRIQGRLESRYLAGLTVNKNKGNQMSHKWICNCLEDEKFRTEAERTELMGAADVFSRGGFIGTPPWDRWVFLVTGKQKDLHKAAKKNKRYQASSEAHPHQIQKPIIFIPFDVLKE